MGSRKDEIEARFGASAEEYATSASHRSGADLERMVEVAYPQAHHRVLDVATGAGHTALAFAPLVTHVTVTDLTHGMIDVARRLFEENGLGNADFRTLAVEELHALGAAIFDIVTCRIAPHHFPDIALGVAEMAGVLKKGGRLVIVDSMAPDNPEVAQFLHEAEFIRDPTHVRSLTKDEWIALFEANGLTVETAEVFSKRHDFEAWVARGGTTPEAQNEVRRRFLEATDLIAQSLLIERNNVSVLAFADEKLLVAGRK